MARHGRLRQNTSRPRCDATALGSRCASTHSFTSGNWIAGGQWIASARWIKNLWIFGCLLVATASAGGPDDPPLADVRVAVEFKSPAPRLWNLRLRLEDAPNRNHSLGEIRNLSPAGTTSGSFDLDPSGQILTIRTRHAISDGKFEMRIRGSREAKLYVEPAGKLTEVASQIEDREIALADLLRSDAITSQPPTAAGEAMAGWTIQRVASDQLRLEDLQRVPVYQPGAPLSLSVRTNGMIDHASQSHVLHYELYRVSSGETVASHRWPIQIDPAGNSQTVAISETVPDFAGVYELRLQVEPDDENIWSRLRRRPPPLVRVTHSIAVLHAAEDLDTERPAWREVGVIRPSESTWSVGQWLPKPTSRLIPGASVPQVPHLEPDSHAGQSVSLIPPLGSFQATLPVKIPGYPHKVIIRLPSSSTAPLQIQVGSSQGEATTSFLLESDSTADNQGPWRQHTFIHYPVENDQIWLTNQDPRNLAAFDSISVQAGPLRLSPAATIPIVPPTSSRIAAIKLPDIKWIERITADVPKRMDLSGCSPATIELNRLWVAAERVQDQVRGHGCNAIVIPANSGAKSWYETSLYQPQQVATLTQQGHLETILDLLESSRLRVFVGLQPNMLMTDIERTIQDQEGQLVELTRNETSIATPSGSASPPIRTQYNPLHPLVQEAIGDLVQELNERCERHGAFAGIVIDGDGNSHLRPLTNAEADAGSVLIFGRAKEMPANVGQLRNWIQQQGGEAFQSWQRLQLHNGYVRISERVGSDRVRILMPGTNPIEIGEGGKSAKPQLLGQDPDRSPPSTANLVSSFRYEPAGVLARKSVMQRQLATAGGPLRSIMFGEETSSNSVALVREQMVCDLCRLIDRTDPNLAMIDRRLVANHFDETLAASLRSFCELPEQRLQESLPIDTASHTVQLRSGTSDGYQYVSMTGIVPWNCDVDLEMTSPTQWEVIGRTDADARDQLIQKSNGTRTRVTIPAGQIVVLRCQEQPGNSIRSWTTRVNGGPEAIESIKQKVTLVVERIGNLNDFKPYTKLTNGGFEQAGDMGLVGWLHAQHPPESVQLDDTQFVEGSHSVMLTTSAPGVARTWLVSETIEAPRSGRLAVSLACRAESKEDDSNHLLRISIEATRQGEPIRFTTELAVPRNGRWGQREVILEADEIDTSAIESLRLTIDSLSGGRVWIDDVQLHDRFPTAKERTEIQNQAFLAVQGLQRGNLLPSGKLLQNHWARYLLSLGKNEQSKRVIENVPEPMEAPGVAERFRNWLPRPLRF